MALQSRLFVPKPGFWCRWFHRHEIVYSLALRSTCKACEKCRTMWKWWR